MPIELLEPAAAVDEALLLHSTANTSWGDASEYFYATKDPAAVSPQQVVDPGIQLKEVLPLPAAFTAQHRNVQYTSFMGLFPPINRAWLTVDSNLFLWSYAAPGNPSAPSHRDNDLYVYEGIPQIIVSVALVRPRPGVFVDSVQHLLAVATSVDVTLLGVAFSDAGEISLLPTNISVATDGVLMLKLHSTPDGRIFMAGSDGSLHEFAYEARPQTGLLDLISGRPPKRARKVVHTPNSLAHYLIPASVKAIFAKEDELVDLAIDPERAALYTLSQAGYLAVYDIDGAGPARLISSVSIAHESRNIVSFSVPAGEREFVSIHAARASNTAVDLIVVTTFGERIYFSSPLSEPNARSMRLAPSRSTNRSVGRHMRSTSLSCVGYRPSPDRLITRSSHPCIHVAWCEKGAAVLADLRDNESDRLISIYPDANLRSASQGRLGDARPGTFKPAEVVMEMTLQSEHRDAPAFPSVMVSPRPFVQPVSADVLGGNATMQVGPRRTFAIAGVHEGVKAAGHSSSWEDQVPGPTQFWVLTSTAMHLYERVQPIDRLREILASGGAPGSEVEAFFARHGAAETCAMCLELAINSLPLLPAAANVFYSYGGNPQYDRRQYPGDPMSRSLHDSDAHRRPPTAAVPGRVGRSARLQFDVGRPSLQPAPLSRFSGTRDGSSLYLAKTLHPIWNEYITTGRDHEEYQSLASPQDLLSGVRDQLLAFISFLSQYPPDTLLPDGANLEFQDEPVAASGHAPLRQSNALGNCQGIGTNSAGLPRNQVFADADHRGLFQVQSMDQARRAESSSISALKNLSIRTAEALALLSILADHQLHRIFVSMPTASREVLVGMRLCDLVVSDNGNVVSASLIEAIFASYADASSALDRVGRILQEKCPSYFEDSDVDLHRGLALLRRAVEEVRNIAELQPEGTTVSGMVTMGSFQLTTRDHPQAEALDNVQNLAEEAARVLKTVPDRVADINAVCEGFRTVGALPLLVDVALTIGKVAETARKQERANIAYEAVFTALSPVVHGTSVEQDGQASGSLSGEVEGIENLRNAVVRVAMTAKSDTFLQKLYEFLLQSKQGEELLLQCSSPMLEKYLEQQNSLDLLWKYCARHGRHFEAASVLFHLADSEKDISLVDRLNYMSCALHTAKTATSKGDGRATSLLTEVSVVMEVAKVQLRVRQELARREDSDPLVEEALKELDGPILELSTLFNKYARPFKLFEASLEALRCGGYRDEAYVRGLWFEILEREASKATTPALLRQRILSLGREFYPSDVAFPTGNIIDLLERMLFKNRSQPLWAGAADWVSNTMYAIGIPLSDLIDGYRRMIETPQQDMSGEAPWSWSEENAQIHLLRATERVISMWATEHAEDILGRSFAFDESRRGFLSECDKVLRAITLCKSRLRGMSSMAGAALVQQFETLEKQVSPLVQ